MGANGTGKSTIMKVLAGLETLDYGQVQQTRGMSIGYLPQEGLALAGRSVFEECLTVFDELREMAREVERLGGQLAVLDHEGAGVRGRGGALLDAAGALSRAGRLRAGRAGGRRADRPGLRQGRLDAADG